jgi:hypothetical protein
VLISRCADPLQSGKRGIGFTRVDQCDSGCQCEANARLVAPR